MKLPLLWTPLMVMLPLAATAQTFDVTMAPSDKNMATCSTADGNWARKWNVAVAGDSAVMSTAGGNKIDLKKIADGVYETSTTIGGGMVVFTATVKGGIQSLKVVGKNLGCVWQGNAP